MLPYSNKTVRAKTQTAGDNTTLIATTAFVANAVLGQNFKEACKYATTTALPAVVYANGSSGVGATLTAVSFGAVSFDGSTPSVGDRVLVKNQVSTFQNGIYTVSVVGAVATLFVLTRATDANQSLEFKTGDSVFITAGTTLTSTTWAYTGVDSPTMGTDAITFVQVAGQGSFTGGTGITITGTSIALTVPVVIANGGTNATTAAAAFNNLSPMTTAGDTIIGGTNGAGTRLAVGANGSVLWSNGSAPSWLTSPLLAGYLRVGSTSAPTNTTAGDITGVRLILPDQAIPAGIRKVIVSDTWAASTIGQALVSLIGTVQPAGIATPTAAALDSDLIVSPSAADAGAFTGVKSIAEHTLGAFNLTGTIYGSFSGARQNVAATTVSTLIGSFSEYEVLAGTATLAVGHDIVRNGGGTITTGIGLRIQASSGGAPSTDIALQSLGGEHRFVGNVKIGADSSPSAPLDVVGAMTGSTTINAGTGYRVAGGATSAHVLRGNGTNFVDSALSTADLSGGTWTTYSYSAGDFTAATGTWTVDSGDVINCSYIIIGKTMILSYNFNATTVSNATGTLRFTIPGGKTGAKQMDAIATAIDNSGNWEIGQARADSTLTYIQFFRFNAANWSITTNGAAIRGQIMFEIQ